jgi:hypothetical protein
MAFLKQPDDPSLGELFEMGFMKPKFDDPISRIGPIGAVPVSGARTFEHPIGKNKLRVPLEEMRATYEESGDLVPRQTVTPESLQGSVLVPAIGDRTAAGKTLLSINDVLLGKPQILQGGMDFMRNKENVWASEKGKVTTQANKIKQAGEDGQPVRTVSSIMGPRAGDYSTMMANSILQQMHAAPVTKEAKTAFDAEMLQKMPNWPGIDKVDENWIANAGSGRTQLAQIMEGARHQKAGFPDIPSTRFAITEPQLLQQPTGSTGFNIATPDPFNISRNPTVPHETYNTQMGGQYFGSLAKPVPRDVMFPDWAKTRPPNEPSPINDYTFERQLPTQQANQQWLDNIMKWWEANP